MWKHLRKKIGAGWIMPGRTSAVSGTLRSKRLAVEPLEPRLVLDAGPLYISELMAINTDTLADTKGKNVNLEVDVIARYLDRLMQGDAAATPGGLSLGTLADNGFLDGSNSGSGKR